MLAVYGIDVLDPRVTPRRILSLARRLPAGAWPDRQATPTWSPEEHLLAGIFDMLGQLTWITARAYGGKATKPKPLPRPGDVSANGTKRPPEGQRTRWADAARQLAGQAGVTVATHG